MIGRLSAALAVANAYLLVLLAAAVRGARTAPPPSRDPGRLRLVVLVPARDEEAVIGATLESLAALAYPPERREVIVVADRCHDRTAAVAATAGATVWRRGGAAEAGKGDALAWALPRVVAERPEAAAVVLVDADCTVDPALLVAVEARLRGGAAAVQVGCRVAEPQRSWVVALRWASIALIDGVRPLGKATLGLSAGLFGTGMAFDRDLLARHPWTARTLLEDQEHHLRIVAAGERVAFAPEVTVTSTMPASLAAARGQGMRWDAGRAGLIRRWTPRLIAAGLRERDAARIHAGLEALVPPQSLLLAANVAAAIASRRAPPAMRGLAVANLAAQATFVGGGLALVRAPAPVWRALAAAPALALWRLGLLARLGLGRGPRSWVPTERGTEAQASTRRAMRRSWVRRTYARSSGSARGARRAPASAQPAR